MIYEECPAPPGLQPFVTGFWLIRARPQARYEKILPGPSAHLVLNLSEPYRLIDPLQAAAPEPGAPRGPAPAEPMATDVSTGFYSGLQRQFLISENPERILNIGAVLTPFGLAAFTEQAPSALQGRVVDADRIFPGFSALRAGLEDPTPEVAFAALAGFLTSRLRTGYRADARTVAAVGILAEEDIPVSVLAGRLGISPSTLERIVMRDCGTTPKSYSDVCRFHRFINAAAALPPGAAAGRGLLALADYYDQPHLIRTFRRFAGFTPSEYLNIVRNHGADYATFVPVEDVPGVPAGAPAWR